MKKLNCDVPGCKNRWNMAWITYGVMRRICNYHFRRHCDKNDSFDLFEVFKMTPPQYLDKFGDPLGRDYKQMMARAEKQQEDEVESQKKKSLERLTKWKQDGNKPKPKHGVPTRPNAQIELDSIVKGILNT